MTTKPEAIAQIEVALTAIETATTQCERSMTHSKAVDVCFDTMREVLAHIDAQLREALLWVKLHPLVRPASVWAVIDAALDTTKGTI
jgi:hypothetical protein